MTAVSDERTLAAVFAGFAMGFGWFTAWEAVQQTRRNRNPLRSAYIYMLWGEIASNVGIGVLGWLMLDGVVPVNFTTLFLTLVFWVFETQLQPQIIINRVAIIAESRRTVHVVRWSTVVFLGLVNVSVFVIWIPSHLTPPPAQIWVDVNAQYDRITKIMILIVDALLNWWFVRVVKQRLVKQHGLVKYQPLISFNSKMMVIAILMDVCLAALLSLPNELVYIQFHPVAYLVKLNIEMSMASLITRLAQGKTESDDDDDTGSARTQTQTQVAMKSLAPSSTEHSSVDEPAATAITRRIDVEVVSSPVDEADDMDRLACCREDDDASLTGNAARCPKTPARGAVSRTGSSRSWEVGWS